MNWLRLGLEGAARPVEAVVGPALPTVAQPPRIEREPLALLVAGTVAEVVPEDVGAVLGGRAMTLLALGAVAAGVLLALPGERIGFLVANPAMPDVDLFMQGSIFCNRVLGFVNAPALMQRLVAGLQHRTRGGIELKGPRLLVHPGV